MAELNVLGQIEILQGSDRRRRTFTASNQTAIAYAWNMLRVSTNSVEEIPMGDAGPPAGRKFLWVESDRPVLINQVSGTVGSYSLASNGFFAAHCAAVTHLWVRNESTVAGEEATVQTVIVATTLT